MVVVWVASSAAKGRWLIPSLPQDLDWWIPPILLVVSIVAFYLIGLFVEGVCGLIEPVLKETRDKRSRERRYRPVYLRVVGGQPPWERAQRWMWTSPQAASQFSRQRLRILVARSTGLNALLLGFGAAAWAPTTHQWWWLLAAPAGFGAAGIFVWIWWAAEGAWQQAVRDADKVGGPPA